MSEDERCERRRTDDSHELVPDGGTSLPDALDGRVRRLTGSGWVTGATVILRAEGTVLGETTTDDEGRYRMPEFGVRVSQQLSADRPDLDVEVRRDGQSVENYHKPFSWGQFEMGEYEFDISAGEPGETDQPVDDGGSSDGDSDDGGASDGDSDDGEPSDGDLDDGGPSDDDEPSDGGVGGSGVIDWGLADDLLGDWNLPPGVGVPDLLDIPNPDSLGGGMEKVPLPCDCQDCESAVSPAAYLAHLLRYADEHVESATDASEDVTIEDLSAAFHQPFDRLPTSCEAVTETVRHPRIATEVLYDYLGTELTGNFMNLYGPPGEGLVRRSVLKTYEQTAYEALLNEWGTSRRELRTANYDEGERAAIAEQVGIAPERVNSADETNLFLDPDAHVVVPENGSPVLNPEALTEANLERVFGLPALTKFDPENGVQDVQDPLRTVEEPAIARWRRTDLRSRWREQDHPTDSYPRFISETNSSGGQTVLQEGERPAVDPDEIGLDDLRRPTGDDAVGTLWRRRREWIDDQLESLWAERPSVERMMEVAFSSFEYPTGGQQVSAAWSRTRITVPQAGDGTDPAVELKPELAPFERLRAHLDAEETDSAALQERIAETLALDANTFDRLATLVETYDTDSKRLTEDDYWEIASILVGARKRTLSEEWIAEERNEGTWNRNDDAVQLGPEQFWRSQREADQGPWSSRLDAHASGGFDAIQAGTFEIPETPGRQTVEVGFEPDLVEFTATVPGAADETRDGRSGTYGWAHGAAQVHDDGSVTQQSIRTSRESDGTASGSAADDAAFALPVTVDGSTVTVTGSVTRSATGGFELDVRAPNLGGDPLPELVVGYRAYRTTADASVEVGHFRTKASSGTQTVQLGVDADHVSLLTSNLVDAADASASGSAETPASLSHGQVAAGDNPDQTVAASTFADADGASYATADDAAIDVLYRSGGGLVGRTTAEATGLGTSMELSYDSVYDGQHNSGGARKLVAYVAVDAGDGRLGRETQPAVGHFRSPSESGTVTVETGFRPGVVEFTAVTAAGSIGTGTTDASGWTHGVATADGQHGLSLSGNAATDDHVALTSTMDAVPILHADRSGRVSGRETGRATVTETGFSVEFPVTASADESAASNDRVVVCYRAWPEGDAPEPYVDPERVNRSDLPEETAGGLAHRLYEHRQAELDEKVEELSSAYESASSDNAFDTVLDAVYGPSLFDDDWATVFDDLAAAMNVEERDPGPRLSVLELSREEFETVRAVHRQAGDDDTDDPGENEVDAAFEVLRTAWKLRERYPSASDGWVTEERTGEWILDVDGSADPTDHEITAYWQARKNAIPARRASLSRRQDWQQALAERSSLPVVEPDVIDERHVAPGNADGRDILEARREAITLDGGGTHPDLTGLNSLTPTSFDATLSTIVGVDGATLSSMRERAKRGEDLSARLRQLDLTYPAFEYLVRIQGKVSENHPVSDHEWENVENLLVAVWKRRTYAAWRREEQARDVFVAPDGFELPESDADSATDAEDTDADETMRWRRDVGSTRDWEDTLVTRIDQLTAVDAQIDEAVVAAEEAAPVSLRDELRTVVNDHLFGEVEPGDVPEPMLNDPGQLVSERLLIDVETSACRETTRVSQATTSLQRLLELLHRKYPDGGPVEPQFELVADQFDAVWNWLGTYPKWKAAVGVYLYPENVLLPTMRERQTPGFEQLERRVRTSSGPLTPDEASDAVAEYVSYAEDVLTLDPEASCLVEVPLPDSDETAHLGYVFGRGNESNTVYYRAFDPETDRASPPGNRDGLWKPLGPLLDASVADVVGACTYEGSVYVFVETGGDRSKLGYVTIDVDADGDSWNDFNEVSLSTDSGGDSDEGDSDEEESSEEDDDGGSGGRDSSIVAAEVVTVEGEDTPPELMVQLSNPDRDTKYDWTDVTVLHGAFQDDGEAPESFGEVSFGLYDLHYDRDGELRDKDQLRPPYRLAGVVRREETVSIGESITNPVRVYNVFLTSHSNYRVYCYHPGERFQPEGTPTGPYGTPQDAHHHKHRVLEDIWNGLHSRWERRKEELEDESTSDLEGRERVERRRLAKQLAVDFTDELQVADLAEYLDRLSSPNDFFLSPAPHWVHYDQYGVTSEILFDHVEEGDWASDHVEGSIDTVLADFGSNTAFAVDKATGTTAHDVRVAETDYDMYPETLDGPILYGGSTLLQCNNARAGDDVDEESFLRRPAIVSQETSLGNTYFGFTRFKRDETDDGGRFDVVQNPMYASSKNLLGPSVPDGRERDHEIEGPWLNGVTLPLEDADLSAEKDRHFNRTEELYDKNYSSLYERTRSTLPYVEEMYFQVPLLLARQLMNSGNFEAALDWFGTIYDHTRPSGERKLWYYLRRTSDFREFQPDPPWLVDPMRPHEVARARTDRYNAYTRFVQFSLVQCLLSFGDDEFGRDTPSSVARATTLYEEALDILDSPELAVFPDPCQRATLSLSDRLGYVESRALSHDDGSPNRRRLLHAVTELGDFRTRRQVAKVADGSVKVNQNGETDEGAKFNEGDHTEIGEAAESSSVTGFTDAAGEAANRVSDFLGGFGPLNNVFESGGQAGKSEVGRVEESETDRVEKAESVEVDADEVGGAEVSRASGGGVTRFAATMGDAVAGNGNYRATLETLMRQDSVAQALTSIPTRTMSAEYDAAATVTVPYEFCVPANPWPKQLRRHAEMNLEKIRTCRNIAGMKRDLQPYAASMGVEGAVPTPTGAGDVATGTAGGLQPTDYRFSTLMQRAKELARQAGQVESEYLHALEQMDQEEYRLRKARQDVELADEQVSLNELRVDRSWAEVELARLQRNRSELKANHYSDLLSSGLIGPEKQAKSNLQEAITLYKWAFGFQVGAAGLHTAAAVMSFVAATLPSSVGLSGISYSPQGSASAVGGGLSSSAAAASSTAAAFSTQSSIRSTWSQLYQMKARYKRREERWRFQKNLARQSVRIGNQKVDVAHDDVDIAVQRREIAELEAEHTRDMVNYLSEEQFTDRELYQWMNSVLGRVYRYFLQEAAAMARLAERQLAFQRQQQTPGIVRSGYWDAPTRGGAIAGSGTDDPDRRGLTGSARLRRDVEQLDQYAFETDERKLQAEKTISLSNLDPIALQRFKETGVVSFATPMELFDRDNPGRYLRLIEDVNVSVVALTPPTAGINAALRTSGNSWVVVGDTIFRKKAIRREPQSISLDRARSAEERENEIRLEPSDREMLRPFENGGVETEWELRMPKAANQFDYDSIADVLLTIEYSALESYDYRQQVQDQLDPERAFDRSFSVKEDLVDEWYDLHNPETADEPMTIPFETDRRDFPPNVSDLSVDDLALYFVGPDGEDLERLTVELEYAESGDDATVGGEATPVEGLVVTPSASSWNSIVGKHPVGEWTLTLPESASVRRLFEDEVIEDVLFVLSVEGRVPDWPGGSDT